MDEVQVGESSISLPRSLKQRAAASLCIYGLREEGGRARSGKVLSQNTCAEPRSLIDKEAIKHRGLG